YLPGGHTQKGPQLFRNMRCIWGQNNDEIPEDLSLAAFEVREFIYADHEARDRCIERKPLNIIFNLADDLMQRLIFGSSRFLVRHRKSERIVVKKLPEFSQEFKNPF